MMHETNARRGLLAVRFVKSLAIANGDAMSASAYAAAQRWDNARAIELALKASVQPVDSSDAQALLTPVAHDFAQFVWGQTLLARIPGVRRVPPNVRLVTGIGGSAGAFAGEGKPVPMSYMSFEAAALTAHRVTALAVISSELLRSSEPNAESVLSAEIAGAMTRALDGALADGEEAVANQRPASIVHDAAGDESTGAGITEIDDDLTARIEALAAAGSDLKNAVWIMSPLNAARLGRLRGSGGMLAFPRANARGGELHGLPLLTSPSVPNDIIILIDGSALAIIDDGRADFSIAKSATAEMRDDPTQSGKTVQVSFWQRNLVGLRLARWLNWTMTREGHVQVITDVSLS